MTHVLPPHGRTTGFVPVVLLGRNLASGATAEYNDSHLDTLRGDMQHMVATEDWARLADLLLPKLMWKTRRQGSLTPALRNPHADWERSGKGNEGVLGSTGAAADALVSALTTGAGEATRFCEQCARAGCAAEECAFQCPFVCATLPHIEHMESNINHSSATGPSPPLLPVTEPAATAASAGATVIGATGSFTGGPGSAPPSGSPAAARRLLAMRTDEGPEADSRVADQLAGGLDLAEELASGHSTFTGPASGPAPTGATMFTTGAGHLSQARTGAHATGMAYAQLPTMAAEAGVPDMEEEDERDELVKRAIAVAAATSCAPGAMDRSAFGRYCITAYIGPHACEAVLALSAHALLCVLPPNVGKAHQVLVEVGDQRSDLTHGPLFAYDRPVVHRVAPDVVPARGGVNVTIMGLHFGASDYSPEARIGGQACLTTTWHSSRRLTCLVPPGTGDNVTVSVTVGGQTGATDSAMRYAGPVVERVEPSHGSPLGGYFVRLFGRNFGEAGQFPTVSVAAAPCQEVRVWSDKELDCLVPPGSGGALCVSVRVAGQQSPPNALFSYTSPIVAAVRPHTCDTAGGCRVTITGDNLGYYHDHSLHVSMGEFACEHVKWRSVHSLTCITSPGVGGQLDVVVRLAGQQSEPNGLFSYRSPLVRRFEPTSGQPQGGDLVRIIGKYFGHKDAAPQAYIGGTPCMVTNWVSDSEVECFTPERTGRNLTVEVRVVNQRSPPAARFDYWLPEVFAASGLHGPAVGGTTVRLLGRFLPPDLQLQYGSKYLCQMLPHASYEEVSCTTVPGVSRSLGIELITAGVRVSLVQTEDGTAAVYAPYAAPPSPERVVEVVRAAKNASAPLTTVDGLEVELQSLNATGNLAFSYDPPVVRDLRPTTVPAAGHRAVHVWGANFGPAGTRSPVFVKLASVVPGGDAERMHACASVTHLSDNELVCMPPAGAEASRLVLVQAGNQNSSANATLLSYDRPGVLSIAPEHGSPEGGYRLRIAGRNFGPVHWPGMWVTVGGLNCTDVAFYNDSALACTVPRGYGAAQAVQVHGVGGQTSAPRALFSYDGPVITRLMGPSVRTSGGKKLNVLGYNFGFGNGSVSGPAVVSVNGAPCADTIFLSSTHLQCVMPAGLGVNLTVMVSVKHVRSPPSNATQFSYEVRDCQVSQWVPWSNCTRSCRGLGERFGHAHNGSGSQYRTRTVTQYPENGGQACPALRDERACNTHPCPVHCVVSHWMEWTPCSRRCRGLGEAYGHGHNETGQQKRARTVVRSPQYNGTACPALVEERGCNTDVCAVHCELASWSPWSECNRPCLGLGPEFGHPFLGNGNKTRHRKVVRPAQHGGTPCGRTEETVACNTQPCPIDCKFSDWSAWSSCNATCGGGAQNRTRSIVRAGRYGGQRCRDMADPALQQTRPCATQPCAKPCEMGEWTAWGPCSSRCGPGQQERSRRVVSPAAHGGAPCPTELKQVQACAPKRCGAVSEQSAEVLLCIGAADKAVRATCVRAADDSDARVGMGFASSTPFSSHTGQEEVNAVAVRVSSAAIPRDEPLRAAVLRLPTAASELQATLRAVDRQLLAVVLSVDEWAALAARRISLLEFMRPARSVPCAAHNGALECPLGLDQVLESSELHVLVLPKPGVPAGTQAHLQVGGAAPELIVTLGEWAAARSALMLSRH